MYFVNLPHNSNIFHFGWFPLLDGPVFRCKWHWLGIELQTLLYERHSRISSGMRINPRRFLHSKVHFALIFYDRPAQSASHVARLRAILRQAEYHPCFGEGFRKNYPHQKSKREKFEQKGLWPQRLQINNWKYPFKLYYCATARKSPFSLLYLRILQKSKNFTDLDMESRTFCLLQQNSTPLDQLVKDDAECKP